MLASNSHHESIRVQGVGDREALPEEFRIPCHFGSGCGQGQLLREQGRGANRHGGFTDHQSPGAQMRCQSLDGAEDLGEVGGIGTGLLRGTDADEVDIGGRGGLGQRGGKSQAAGGNIAVKYLGQARLIERNPPTLQNLDLGRIDIDPDDLKTQLGHAGGVGGP